MASNNTGQMISTGKAVFVVNIRCSESPVDDDTHRFYRGAARHDSASLANIFVDKFGFTWENQSENQYLNVSLENWDHVYRRDGRVCQEAPLCCKCQIRSLDFSESEKYFMLAISSHGFQEEKVPYVVFSDQKCLKMSKILESLNDENSPNLKGKVRIVLLQACRGDIEAPIESVRDYGSYLYVAYKTSDHQQTDIDIPTASPHLSLWPQDPLEDISPAIPKNFLVVYATPPGRNTFLNSTEGSWMLAEMKKIVVDNLQHQPEVDFLDLFTRVNYKVSLLETKGGRKENGKIVEDKENSGKKTCLYIRHRLVTHVKFNVRPSLPLANPAL